MWDIEIKMVKVVPQYGKQNGLENENSNDQKQGIDIEEDG
jgi:hypothetical protein